MTFTFIHGYIDVAGSIKSGKVKSILERHTCQDQMARVARVTVADAMDD